MPDKFIQRNSPRLAQIPVRHLQNEKIKNPCSLIKSYQVLLTLIYYKHPFFCHQQVQVLRWSDHLSSYTSFNHWMGLIPTPFTRVRIYYYIPSYFRGRETFSKAKRRFALLRWRLVLYPTCVSSTAPRSLLWYYHYFALRTTAVISWLYSELGHTLAFSNYGSNQFHTIRTLITNHHNLFHSTLLFSL